MSRPFDAIDAPVNNTQIRQDHPCTYKQSFPMDEFGRIGGMHSLADLPIVRHSVLEREGILTAMDSEQELYAVEDAEKGWKFVVAFADVVLQE